MFFVYLVYNHDFIIYIDFNGITTSIAAIDDVKLGDTQNI